MNLTTMEDLDDDMLTQILLRLPNPATALACSPVNKRWCALISEHNFPILFTNHKKKTTTLLKSSGSDIDDDEPPWSLTTTEVKPNGRSYVEKVENIIILMTEVVFGSPKLSLDFLPCYSFSTTATFKDLVLCFNHTPDHRGGRLYYIANPLTKQWVALPPTPRQLKLIKSTALICQPPYNHTQDYKFRVVEVHDRRMDRSLDSLDTFYLLVYCSENGIWKEIKLRIPKEAGPFREFIAEPETVVCNGIIYFKSGVRLVALNPFDVNDTCNSTVEARVMPPLPNFGYLLESSGQLLVVHTPNRWALDCLPRYKKVEKAIELEMVGSKLGLNQAPLVWETTFQGLCKGDVNTIKLPACVRFEGKICAEDIVVHPYNDKLIYMYLAPLKQFVLCDTRIGCITSSKRLPNNVWRFHRLEHEWWPTSVPAS